MICVYFGGVRIPSVLRSDQSGNGRVGAPVSHASDLFIFHPHVSLPPFQLSMLAHCLLLKHRCKIPANESHLFPPSQPPASPLLHFIFYTFSCPSGATTPHIPTPLLHCSLLISGLDLLVGTQNVYKLSPFKDGEDIRLLRINLVVFPPSFLYAFMSRLVASALTRVEPLSTLCPVSLSLISYQSLFLTASYLG